MLANEAASFVVRLRDEVRTYVLGRMPTDPSGELAAMDLSSLLIAYGNWQGRYVRVHPRSVRESRELQANPKYTDHAQALAAVSAEIFAGRDLTSRLSGQVKTAYVPTSKRRAGKHRPDQDLLLGDWGIHHLHLGESRIDVARVARTGDVLLAYFTGNAAYLIDIVGHPATDNWAQRSILRTAVQNFPELADRWRLRGNVRVRASRMRSGSAAKVPCRRADRDRRGGLLACPRRVDHSRVPRRRHNVRQWCDAPTRPAERTVRRGPAMA